jgi:KUP system potassium uptake protein
VTGSLVVEDITPTLERFVNMAHSKSHPGSTRGLLPLALGALGVVYGDIGTSPIYAFNESVHAGGAGKDNILGVVSLIFWTLTVVVSIKYLIVVLRADNHGEGGVLALFALLPERIKTAKRGKYVIVIFMMLLAAAFLFADGLLTPAISVLSATEGLGNINPDLVHFAVPATVVILLVLFIFQFRGSGFLGGVFGPVMLVWFLLIGGLGLYQVAQNPAALAGLNPSYAISFIGSHGWSTLIVMASVILSVTGAEALYADLGHFGKRPIRVSWFGIVAITLVLSYLGQAALILRRPELVGNAFFGQVTEQWQSIVLVIIATAATIIASQALISGVASIANQAIRLGLIARMKIVHTSEHHYGQTYVPFVNALLGIGSIALVIIFESSAALAGAYAFAIAGTMVITTIALFWVAADHWHWKKYFTIPLLSLFLIFDVSFLAATSTKIHEGAWLPLLIGFVVASIMWIWRKGRALLNERLRSESLTWKKLARERKSPRLAITPGTGIYLSALADLVPQSLEEQIRVLHSMPEKIVVVNVETLEVPRSRRKPEVRQINDYTMLVTVYSGFMDITNLPRALRSKALEGLIDEKDATYFVTSRKFVSPPPGALNKIEDMIFDAMHRNSSLASDYFRLPTGRVITISVSD